MRVVLVDLMCNSPFYCAELTRALCDAGVDAVLASPRFHLEPRFLDAYPRPTWIRDLVVHARRPRPLRLAVRAVEGTLNYARLLARIRARAFDVVHVQWVPFEGRASPFMRLLRSWCDRTETLLVYTAHNAVPHDSARVDLAALRHDLDSAHLVVAHADHVARELAHDIGTVTPMVVIPHGPLFTYRQLPPREEAAARVGRFSRPVVLFQGLIRRYKGLDLVAGAWPDVTKAFPDASLLVVGRVADAFAASDVARLRAQESVHIVDRFVRVSEMLDYYAVADVVVFPYRRTSQSGALMTAVGLGRPTVVTPIDGLREQVEGLRSASVADEVSEAALARALVTSLEQREAMAVAAEEDRRVVASSPTGWASVARATAQAYEARRRALGYG
jgi:glycosyltransferase involved in cell wall biosynthesis